MEDGMRKILSLNDGWRFVMHDADPARMPEDGEAVCLPHSWNAVDGHDGHDIDKPSRDWSQGDLQAAPAEHYNRGGYWYFHSFDTPVQPLPGGRTYVEIPAAGQQAEIYVNGQLAASHEGGYSAFRADVTDLCSAKDNLLAIHVSNEFRTGIYPQHADFTFYGGLYRGVNLISVASAHFDLDYYGGPGISIHAVPDEFCAWFDLKAWVCNADENHTVFWSILGPDGTESASALRPANAPDVKVPVYAPKLWSPDSPNLYTVTAQLIRRNEVVDEVTLRTGIRSFSCTPDQGFFLNGRALPLRGVCRHQDQLYKGNALTREDHFLDA